MVTLIGCIFAMLVGVGLIILSAQDEIVFLLALGIIILCVSWIPLCGLRILRPQEALVLTLLMSALIFKEKIKPLCIIGLIILFVGLIFINIIPLLI